MAIEFEKINREESWRIFDAAAKRLLRIDGDTFARRWDQGAYGKDANSDVVKVAMLRPYGR